MRFALVLTLLVHYLISSSQTIDTLFNDAATRVVKLSLNERVPYDTAAVMEIEFYRDIRAAWNGLPEYLADVNNQLLSCDSLVSISNIRIENKNAEINTLNQTIVTNNQYITQLETGADELARIKNAPWYVKTWRVVRWVVPAFLLGHSI